MKIFNFENLNFNLTWELKLNHGSNGFNGSNGLRFDINDFGLNGFLFWFGSVRFKFQIF